MPTFLLIPGIPVEVSNYAKHIDLKLSVDTCTCLPLGKYIEYQCAKNPATQMKSLGSQITVQSGTFSAKFNTDIMLLR